MIEEWGANIGRAWAEGLIEGIEKARLAIEVLADRTRIELAGIEVDRYFYRAMPWPWRLRRRIVRAFR